MGSDPRPSVKRVRRFHSRPVFMTAVVRLALSRPYTFVVMAILIMIFGTLSAIRTPTDIFPNIGIPVISVVWGYTGLAPDDMAGRIVAPYERVLSTTVNDIEHIEFAVVSRDGRCQNLLPAERRHQRCASAGHIDFANHFETASRGGHATDHSGLQRLERPDHPAGLVQRLRFPRSNCSISPKTSSGRS